MVLSLVFLCFTFLLSNINFTFGKYKISKQFVSAQYSAAEDAASLSDPSGGNAEDLYSSFAGTQDVSSSKNGSSGAGMFGNVILIAINAFLYAVFKFMGIILLIAGNLFDWAVNARNFKEVMGMNSIQQGWIIFRDFLNIFFILILLFSAFCTIFQVSKYHIKNILLTLVIMALLVNFSFPVSRAVIDAGNIPMYHFLTAIGGGESNASISKNIFNSANTKGINEPSGLMDVIFPSTTKIEGDSNQTLQLIAAIAFTFLFAITLLVMAVLLILRLLVLALLVMASPVGFVGAIFPGFSQYSEKWWSQLFKQSFFGTIMAFMLYISLSIMKESQAGITASMAASAGAGDKSGFSTLIVAGVTMSIPIVLLWIAMISAQKLGAAGASSVVGQATKVAKWAGKLPYRGAKGMANATGISGGVKQAFDYYKKKGAPGVLGKIPGLRGSEKRENSESWVANKLTGGKAGYSAKGLERKRLAEKVSEYEKADLSVSDATSKLSRGSREEKKAAALYLSKKEKIDEKTYRMAMNAFKDEENGEKDESETQKKITQQVKKDNRIDVLIDYEVEKKKGTQEEITLKYLEDIEPGKLKDQWKLLENVAEKSDKGDAIAEAFKKYNKKDPTKFRMGIAKMSTKRAEFLRSKDIIPKDSGVKSGADKVSRIDNNKTQEERNRSQVDTMIGENK